MSHQNISALPRSPDWLLSDPNRLPRPGAATDARPGMPRTHLSGYEQILAARAALRAEVDHAAAAERWAFASSSPAPARFRMRPKQRRRRSRLFISGLVAAPTCAVLAGLAWVGPAPAPPDARIAAPAAALTPAAPPLASSHGDAPGSAAEAGAAPDRETLHAAASQDVDDEAQYAVLAVYAVRDDGETIALEAAGPEAEAQASHALPQAAFADPDEPLAEEKALVAAAAAMDPTAADAAPLSAATGEPPAIAPVADAIPVEASGSAAAPPTPPQPEHRMMALAPPSLAQGDRGLVKIRNSVPPRPTRALDNDASSAEARCRSIIMKAQLGEEASHVDRTYLRTACKARR